MNATIGLLAYGLQPSPLTEEAPTWLLAAGAYSSYSWELQMAAAHAGCHVSAFCRNPLHPGPCKGWKHHLGLVSPGALHALEKVRHDKLEEKRQAKVKALQDAGHAVPKSLLKPIVYDPAKNKYLQQPDKITPGLGIPTKGLTPEAAKATLEKIPTKAQVGEKLDAKHAAEAAAKPKTPLEAWEAGGEHRDALTKQELLNLAHQVGPYSAKSKEIHQYIQDNKKKLDKQAADHLAGLAVQAKADNAAKQAKLAKVNEDKGPLSDAEKAMFAKVGGGGISKSETGGWVHEPSGDPVSKDEAAALDSLAERGALQVIGGNVLPSGLGKHLAAGGTVPHQAPQYLTISKAGLKEGDQVFLHGKGKTAGEGQLVTVHKYGAPGGGKSVGGGKAQGYGFKDVHGNEVMAPHQEGVVDHPLAGGTASKWHLSPAPGKAFPGQAAPTPKLPTQGHKTTPGQVPDVLAAKHKAQGEAYGKFFHQVLGVPHDPESQKKYEELAAKKAEAGEPLAEADKIEAGAKKIAAKIYPIGGNAALMHQGDLEQALIKDIHEGVNEGRPTPVLDAAREAGVTLGQGKPGAAQALADAVHAKLGISGHDDTPAKPDMSGFFGTPKKGEPIGSPNAGAAPHVKQAIAYANGHQTANDTKKLAAYQELTLDEINKLDPSTKQLMAANLAGMHKKFLDPKKKEAVQELLNDVQKAQGGGAGAGGSSAVSTPAVSALDHKGKAAQGAANAYAHNFIPTGPGTSVYDMTQGVFEGMHSNPDHAKVEQAFQSMGEAHATKLLSDIGLDKSTGFGAAIHPAITKEMVGALKGETTPTPLTNALHNSSINDHGPLIDAATKHLGPDALGVKQATSVSPADVAHALSMHAASSGPSNGAPDWFVKSHENALAMYGTEGHHAALAKAYASSKMTNSIKKLNLGGDEGSKLAAQMAGDKTVIENDYKKALDSGNTTPGGVAGQIDKLVSDVNAKGDALAEQNGWPKDSPAVKTWKSAYFANKLHDMAGGTPQAGAGGTSTHVSPAAPIPSGPGALGAPTIATGSAHSDISDFSEQVKNHLFSAYKSAHKGTVLSAPIQDQYDNLVAVAHHYAGEHIGFSSEMGKTSHIPHDLSVAQVAKVVDESLAAHLNKPNQHVLENKILSWLQTPEGTAYANNHTVDQSLANALATSTQTAKDIKLAPGEKVQKLAGPGKYQASKTVFDFKPLSAEEMQKSQDDYLKATGTEWNHDQVTALANYTTGAYYEINSYLRGENKVGAPVTDVSSLTKDRIKVMQSAMRPLQQDTLLKRGTGLEQFPPHMRSFDGLKAAIGKTFKEPAFMSTTVGGEGGNFEDTALLQIEAPAGTQAAWVRHVSHNSHENEVVLAAGSHFRITHVEKDEYGNIRVQVRVVS